MMELSDLKVADLLSNLEKAIRTATSRPLPGQPARPKLLDKQRLLWSSAEETVLVYRLQREGKMCQKGRYYLGHEPTLAMSGTSGWSLYFVVDGMTEADGYPRKRGEWEKCGASAQQARPPPPKKAGKSDEEIRFTSQSVSSVMLQMIACINFSQHHKKISLFFFL